MRVMKHWIKLPTEVGNAHPRKCLTPAWMVL